jgi:hypothetical protein
MNEYGIALCFDPTTEAKLRKVKDTFQIPKALYTRPHVTLTVVNAKLLNSVQRCRKSDIFGKASLVEVVIVGAGGKEITSFALGKSS